MLTLTHRGAAHGNQRNQRSRRNQRGLSLVELMVGIVVGMFVVAAASMLVASQLADNRRMLVEVQVQQDLRAAADIITRELRRAGSWGDVNDAQLGISLKGINPSFNPLLAVTPAPGASAPSVSYKSSRAGSGSTGPYGFRLNGGVIQSKLDETSGWQALTDEATMTVTRFEVGGYAEPPVRVACSKSCVVGPPPLAADAQACWPTVSIRRFVVEITGRAVSDPRVVRSVRSAVRLRNDELLFNDATNPALACPV